MSGILAALMLGSTLDMQTVTSGATGTNPNMARGFSTVAFGIGSIATGHSALYGGATISEFYWFQNGGSPNDIVVFQVAALVANSGWTKVVIDGTNTFLRANATFSQPGGTSSQWQWSNTGNPFGIGGSVHSCVFS